MYSMYVCRYLCAASMYSVHTYVHVCICTCEHAFNWTLRVHDMRSGRDVSVLTGHKVSGFSPGLLWESRLQCAPGVPTPVGWCEVFAV